MLTWRVTVGVTHLKHWSMSQVDLLGVLEKFLLGTSI